MSDYFNETGTIGFTCDVCGREIQGCTWVNGMKFCAKCYQETFGNTNPFEKELRDKIADLEAKLEQLQKEKELDNSFWKQECDSLQKALAEKEKELNDICQNHDFQLNDFSREVYRLKQREKLLKQQLEEANHERHEEWKTGKEWKWEWQKTNRLLEEANQAKTDLAIAQLEKVKEIIDKRNNGTRNGNHSEQYKDGYSGCCCDIADKIDQQINKLKEKK